MKLFTTLIQYVVLLVLLTSKTVFAESNEDVILPPTRDDGLPVKMIILIPGANVATSYYVETAKAIQEATTKLSLWVLIPSVTQEKCIILCPSRSFCSPLHYVVGKVVEKAESMGYPTNSQSKPFLVGHSLGGVCASTLASAYGEDAYDSLVVLGSYVTDQDVANFPMPVLTLGAQLDGGLGRPGMLTKSLTSALSVSKTYDDVVKNKPVVILPGLDHSSFCPGFKVPGDVWPADIDDKTAGGMIASVVAAFLHLRVQFSSDDLSVLRNAMTFTKDELLKPYFDALTLEHDEKTTPWCVVAQQYLSGLSDEDLKRLKIQNGAEFFDDAHQFEHSRVGYTRSSNGDLLLNVSGHTDLYKGGITDLGDSCLVRDVVSSAPLICTRITRKYVGNTNARMNITLEHRYPRMMSHASLHLLIVLHSNSTSRTTFPIVRVVMSQDSQ